MLTKLESSAETTTVPFSLKFEHPLVGFILDSIHLLRHCTITECLLICGVSLASKV